MDFKASDPKINSNAHCISSASILPKLIDDVPGTSTTHTDDLMEDRNRLNARHTDSLYLNNVSLKETQTLLPKEPSPWPLLEKKSNEDIRHLIEALYALILHSANSAESKIKETRHLLQLNEIHLSLFYFHKDVFSFKYSRLADDKKIQERIRILKLYTKLEEKYKQLNEHDLFSAEEDMLKKRKICHEIKTAYIGYITKQDHFLNLSSSTCLEHFSVFQKLLTINQKLEECLPSLKYSSQQLKLDPDKKYIHDKVLFLGLILNPQKSALKTIPKVIELFINNPSIISDYGVEIEMQACLEKSIKIKSYMDTIILHIKETYLLTQGLNPLDQLMPTAWESLGQKIHHISCILQLKIMEDRLNTNAKKLCLFSSTQIKRMKNRLLLQINTIIHEAQEQLKKDLNLKLKQTDDKSPTYPYFSSE
jgi:hypothetical protein